MTDVAGGAVPPRDRTAVLRTAGDLVLGVMQRRTPAGISIVLEGAPGIGKTYLVSEILAAVPPGSAPVLRVTGDQRRRNDPFAGFELLLADTPGAGGGRADPPASRGDTAFDRIDELCASGPVVIAADDAHHLDAASLALLRRLAWASRSLPLALLISTRPSPSREPLARLAEAAQLRLRVPPMDKMMVERLVFDRTGRWPGPRLRRVLDLAAGHPLFAGELLRAYGEAGALVPLDPDSIEARSELDLQATGLDALIAANLAQLDEPTRDVLAAMAVWGTEISAGDLASLLERPADALGESLERAVSSGLARRDAAGSVGFAHDLFREVTYGTLPAARRRAEHRKAAGVLGAAGYRPALVTGHLLLAAGAAPDPEVATALRHAAAATLRDSPEVTAEFLEDLVAVGGPELSEPLLRDRVQALFLSGRAGSRPCS